MAGLIIFALLGFLIAGCVWLVRGYARVSLWAMIKMENTVQRRRLKRSLPPD